MIAFWQTMVIGFSSMINAAINPISGSVVVTFTLPVTVFIAITETAVVWKVETIATAASAAAAAIPGEFKHDALPMSAWSRPDKQWLWGRCQ